MSAQLQPNKVPPLNVTADAGGKPLRACVEDALRKYFQQLDGHAPGNLYDMVLQEAEQPLLKVVLDHTGGNQSRAAEILGVSRGTLRKKLRQYGLDR